MSDAQLNIELNEIEFDEIPSLIVSHCTPFYLSLCPGVLYARVKMDGNIEVRRKDACNRNWHLALKYDDDGVVHVLLPSAPSAYFHFFFCLFYCGNGHVRCTMRLRPASSYFWFVLANAVVCVLQQREYETWKCKCLRCTKLHAKQNI